MYICIYTYTFIYIYTYIYTYIYIYRLSIHIAKKLRSFRLLSVSISPRHQAQGVAVGFQLGHPPLRLQRLVVAQAPDGPRQGRAAVPGAAALDDGGSMGFYSDFIVTLWNFIVTSWDL